MYQAIDRALALEIVQTVKSVCGRNINIIDCSGVILASTDPRREGSFHEIGKKAASAGTAIEVEQSGSYAGTQEGVNLPVYYGGSVAAVIGISGPPGEVRRFADLAARITELLIREREMNASGRLREEKRMYLLRSLIFERGADGAYLMSQLSDYGIFAGARVRVFLIRIRPEAGYLPGTAAGQEILRFFDASGVLLHTFFYPGEYIGIIKADEFLKYRPAFQAFACSHRGLLGIGIGKSCPVPALSDSYESALTALAALEPGGSGCSLFDELTVEPLLFRMTARQREDFLQKTIAPLPEADRALLRVYYEEEMSLSAACRRLFIHKNTLQYRLDRIHRICGLNPRRFRDGVLLYLALRLPPQASAVCGSPRDD